MQNYFLEFSFRQRLRNSFLVTVARKDWGTLLYGYHDKKRLRNAALWLPWQANNEKHCIIIMTGKEEKIEDHSFTSAVARTITLRWAKIDVLNYSHPFHFIFGTCPPFSDSHRQENHFQFVLIFFPWQVAEEKKFQARRKFRVNNSVNKLNCLGIICSCHQTLLSFFVQYEKGS